jgi:hypothetical protein
VFPRDVEHFVPAKMLTLQAKPEKDAIPGVDRRKIDAHLGRPGKIGQLQEGERHVR